MQDLKAVELAQVSIRLGSGRDSAQDSIDYAVGISLQVQVGSPIQPGNFHDNGQIIHVLMVFFLNRSALGYHPSQWSHRPVPGGPERGHRSRPRSRTARETDTSSQSDNLVCIYSQTLCYCR